jgi:hypothetical protein
VPDHHDARGFGVRLRRPGAAGASGAESGHRELRPGVPAVVGKVGHDARHGHDGKAGRHRRARQHPRPPRRGGFLHHRRPQMVSVGADVRCLPGAGAGAGRAHLLLRAALSPRRFGQCAAIAAAQGQARQPLQRVERSRVRRRVCVACRRRGRRHPHHHPDGAVDAARLRPRLGRLHAHGAGAGRAPLPLSLGVPEASSTTSR